MNGLNFDYPLCLNESNLLTSYIILSLQITLDAIEIDPEIVKVAKKWFDCKEDEQLRIITGDGLEFINNKALNNGMRTEKSLENV